MRSLSDQDLLERRISKLGLRLEGTTLEPLIKQLYDELSAHGLVFHPPTHFGDEWFVLIGISAIFVPFLLREPYELSIQFTRKQADRFLRVMSLRLRG